MSLIGRIDDFLYRRVTHAWPRARVTNYTETLVAAQGDAVVPAVVREQFALIDGKAATLLVHTSMMVAAIGIVATLVAGSKFEQLVMIIEIMLYLIISILCLRSTSLFHGWGGMAEPGEAIRRELILRRELFTMSNNATIYLTIAVIATLPIVLYL